MYSNKANIALPMAVWLAADDGYDHVFTPDVYSVTEIINSIRSVVLTRRLKAQQATALTDLTDIVASRLGNAIHTAIETAWMEHRTKALRNLDIPESVTKRIRLNPDTPEPGTIPIYIEMRTKREIAGVTLTGKFDFVYEGRVRDSKSTKVYNWIKGGNNKKYALQGSMYRWLNPTVITDDYVDIDFLFKDWKKWEAIKGGDYPPFQIMTKTLPLMSLQATEDWILTKLTAIRRHETMPQQDLPLCNAEELWMDPPKWAYKSKATNVKATKLCDSAAEAYALVAQKGGVVEERKSEPTFCTYCEAREICTQAAGYIDSGLLKL